MLASYLLSINPPFTSSTECTPFFPCLSLCGLGDDPPPSLS